MQHECRILQARVIFPTLLTLASILLTIAFASSSLSTKVSITDAKLYAQEGKFEDFKSIMLDTLKSIDNKLEKINSKVDELNNQYYGVSSEIKYLKGNKNEIR